MAPPRFIQPQRPKNGFQHGEDTAPLTGSHQTGIRMPNLNEECDFNALFVLDEGVPVEMINELLKKVGEEAGEYLLWLADETLEELKDETTTTPPIPSTWRSPFVGKTIREAFQYLSTIPLELSIGRSYIAVLNKQLYENKGWIILYKIDDEGEVTSIPCAAHLCTAQMDSYAQDSWPSMLKEWREKGTPVM